jgi:hypothetical protein
MTLYSRADVSSVSVPVTSGGCGQTHSRPVLAGAPVQGSWPLNCVPCENYLRADIARSGGKKIRTVNNDFGLKMQDRYLGLWGTREEMVPETPDQEKQREFAEQETARHQASAQSETFTKIGNVLSGNAELMAKFMEFQMEFMSQQGQQPPVELVSSTRIEELAPEAAAMPAYVCQGCGGTFPRKSAKGYAPRRCADCKAKAAA